MYTPFLKYFLRSSFIPNGTAGELKLAKPLLALVFDQTGCQWEGCQSSQPFSFHSAKPRPPRPPASPFLNDMNKYTSVCCFMKHWLYFSSSLCTFLLWFNLYSLAFGLRHWLINNKNFIFFIIPWRLPLCSVFWKAQTCHHFCSCLSDWYSLQCHFRSISIICYFVSV